MADEIDRAVFLYQGFQFAEQPRDVLVLGGTEALGHGAAETRKMRSDDIGTTELGEERLPNHGCLRISMQEDDGHGLSVGERLAERAQSAAAFLSKAPAKTPVCSPFSMNTSPLTSV